MICVNYPRGKQREEFIISQRAVNFREMSRRLKKKEPFFRLRGVKEVMDFRPNFPLLFLAFYTFCLLFQCALRWLFRAP